MRPSLVVAAAVVAVTAPAFAARLAPSAIQSPSFNGHQAAAESTNVKYKVTCPADGMITGEPVGAGGAKAEGTWKLTKEGFCTTWKGSKPNCYRLVTAGDNKWSVMKGSTSVATWTK